MRLAKSKNIPLLDAIKQVPRYAKFLKELCINKRKLKGNDKINSSEKQLSSKGKFLLNVEDLGTFTIPCKICSVGIKKVMYDVGASINVMPFICLSMLDYWFIKGNWA